MDTPQLHTGEMFAERFSILRMLGQGGMGTVYLAKDSMLNEELVALKILHSDLCRDEKHVKRFLREVQLTRKVTHPNVVRTFEMGQHKQQLYFTMEYAEGLTLKEKAVRGSLNGRSIIPYLRQLLEGLDAIHSNQIIHRDLKPGNVIVTSDDTLKITDFGVARPDHSDLTGHNEVVGSIPYMAPEVWKGSLVDQRADLYSVGVMIYELLTGILPFEADSPAEMMKKHLYVAAPSLTFINNSVPPELDAWVLKLLQKDPSKRPLNAAQALVELNARTPGVGQPLSLQPAVEKHIDASKSSVEWRGTTTRVMQGLGRGFSHTVIAACLALFILKLLPILYRPVLIDPSLSLSISSAIGRTLVSLAALSGLAGLHVLILGWRRTSRNGTLKNYLWTSSAIFGIGIGVILIKLIAAYLLTRFSSTQATSRLISELIIGGYQSMTEVTQLSLVPSALTPLGDQARLWKNTADLVLQLLPYYSGLFAYIYLLVRVLRQFVLGVRPYRTGGLDLLGFFIVAIVAVTAGFVAAASLDGSLTLAFQIPMGGFFYLLKTGGVVAVVCANLLVLLTLAILDRLSRK